MVAQTVPVLGKHLLERTTAQVKTALRKRIVETFEEMATYLPAALKERAKKQSGQARAVVWRALARLYRADVAPGNGVELFVQVLVPGYTLLYCLRSSRTVIYAHWRRPKPGAMGL